MAEQQLNQINGSGESEAKHTTHTPQLPNESAASYKTRANAHYNARIFMRQSMMIVVCVGLFMVVQAASSAVAAEEGGARRLGAIYGGYQTAEYSFGDAVMSVGGVYLGAGASVFADWLEVEASIGYTVGDTDDLNTALVSDLETVMFNVVLKPTYHIENFSIYGKVGLNYSLVTYSVGWGLWSTSAFGGVVGGGASYDFDNGFGLHIECLSYIGTDSIQYDGPSDGSAQGGDIDYSPEVRIGGSFSF